MISNPLAEDLDHILKHTGDIWENLKGQRIFITGGTGFLGSWLLESFAWANDRLNLNATAVVLSRNPDLFASKAPHLASHPSIRFHRGDVRSFKFPKESFSHIIHSATAVSTLNQNPIEELDIIIQGTKHTLEFARHCGAKNFLLTSSGAVYGNPPETATPISENYQGELNVLAPNAFYGEGKRIAEILCLLWAKEHGLEAKIARCFVFQGPYLPLDAHFAVGNFIRDSLKGGPIIISGDGLSCRSYLYAADLTIWLWIILFRGISGRPYNVGSEKKVTIRELAETISSQFKNKIEVKVLGKSTQNSRSHNYLPQIHRAKEELKLSEHISLDEGLRRTIAFYFGIL